MSDVPQPVLAEWHADMLRDISDIFSAAITDARTTAEIRYALTLTLEQQRLLEKRYGKDYTTLIRGIMCDAAHLLGMQLPGCEPLRNTDPTLRYEHIPTQQIPHYDVSKQDTSQGMKPIPDTKRQIFPRIHFDKDKP